MCTNYYDMGWGKCDGGENRSELLPQESREFACKESEREIKGYRLGQLQRFEQC